MVVSLSLCNLPRVYPASFSVAAGIGSTPPAILNYINGTRWQTHKMIDMMIVFDFVFI